MLTNEQSHQLDIFEKALDEEYRNKKDAIRFMRQFLTGSMASSIQGSLLQGASALGVPAVLTSTGGEETAELPPLDVDDGPTLIGKVYDIMERYPNEKWTMRRMLAYLQKQKFSIKNNKPEASISAALSKLTKMGKIKAVRPGVGKSQGIYQWNPNYMPENEEITEAEDEADLVEAQ